jgi:hypothetical protein
MPARRSFKVRSSQLRIVIVIGAHRPHEDRMLSRGVPKRTNASLGRSAWEIARAQRGCGSPPLVRWVHTRRTGPTSSPLSCWSIESSRGARVTSRPGPLARGWRAAGAKTPERSHSSRLRTALVGFGRSTLLRSWYLVSTPDYGSLAAADVEYERTSNAPRQSCPTPADELRPWGCL